MTKHEVVLDLVDDGSIDYGSDAYFDGGKANGTGVFVPLATFRDMESPNKITVTIEPGDRLNTEES
jgi:hypothetical protein